MLSRIQFSLSVNMIEIGFSSSCHTMQTVKQIISQVSNELNTPGPLVMHNKSMSHYNTHSVVPLVYGNSPFCGYDIDTFGAVTGTIGAGTTAYMRFGWRGVSRIAEPPSLRDLRDSCPSDSGPSPSVPRSIVSSGVSSPAVLVTENPVRLHQINSSK
jgi:hypothetical protein